MCTHVECVDCMMQHFQYSFFNQAHAHVIEPKGMILHENKHETDELDLPQIAEDFISRNERKRNTLGTYNITK